MAKKKKKFSFDWKFFLIMILVIGGIGGLMFGTGAISPIDKHMQSQPAAKNGFLGGFSVGGDSAAPEGSFEVMGSSEAIHFAYLDPQYTTSKTTLRAIGNAICHQEKTPDYCEVYFWTNKEDIVIKLPVRRDGSLFAFYEIKQERVKLKLMQ